MRYTRFLVIVGLVVLGSGVAWYALKRTREVGAALRSLGGVRVHRDMLKGKKPLIALAVIGSGPAGLSAGLYGSRFNLHTVVFEGKKPGGQLMSTSDVENWPGITRELGPKIMGRLKAQATQFGMLTSSSTVENIDTKEWPYSLKLDDGSTVYALSVIIATGAVPVTLKVPGEQEYWGKGVTSCAVCDAPFFKQKKVVVVGGGDAAAEEALQLASYADEITLLVRADKMRASHAMQERLKAYEKISIRYNVQVAEILGNSTHVTGVKLKTATGDEQVSIDGVFLAIGHSPNSALVKSSVRLDPQGYILVGPQGQETSQPGIFAAGDVADRWYRQAGIASGDGIKAAIDAAHFLWDHGMDDAALAPYASSWFEPDVSVKNIKELTEVTSVEQFEKLLESDLPVIVDFYTPECPSCKALLPHLAVVAQQNADKVIVVKVDGSKLPELMQRYNISSVPLIIAFQEGVVVGRSSHLLASRKDIEMFVAQFIG